MRTKPLIAVILLFILAAIPVFAAPAVGVVRFDNHPGLGGQSGDDIFR